MMTVFASLSESQRAILTLIIAIVILLAIIGYIGALIIFIMKKQGARSDRLMNDIFRANIAENRRVYLRIARKKNELYFIKTSFIPFLILLAVTIMILIVEACHGWSYSLTDYKKTGFTTIFFLWDWADPKIWTKVFWMTLLCDWPKLINTPHFEVEAIYSYIAFFGWVIGGCWYLFNVQGLIARQFHARKTAERLYESSLQNITYDDVVEKEALKQQISNQNSQDNNNQNPNG